MYYNTTHLTGAELSKAVYSAQTQEQRVLLIFKQLQTPLTPFEVLRYYCGYWQGCPVTSIRRAMTNLTKYGVLEKTDLTEKGNYGAINYKWKLK